MSETPDKLPGLPATLAAIAEIVGLKKTLRVVKKAGGSRIYIHKRSGRGLTLETLIGTKAARDLSAKFGGESIHIPNAKATLNAYRARTLRREGRTVREIAQTLRLSERWIHELTRGIEPGDQAARGAAKSEGDAS